MYNCAVKNITHNANYPDRPHYRTRFLIKKLQNLNGLIIE